MLLLQRLPQNMHFCFNHVLSCTCWFVTDQSNQNSLQIFREWLRLCSVLLICKHSPLLLLIQYFKVSFLFFCRCVRFSHGLGNCHSAQIRGFAAKTRYRHIWKPPYRHRLVLRWNVSSWYVYADFTEGASKTGAWAPIGAETPSRPSQRRAWLWQLAGEASFTGLCFSSIASNDNGKGI